MAPNPNQPPAPAAAPGEKKPRFGRPTKLTRELIEKVAGVVRSGCYLDTAARFCGVSKASFHDWMKRGHEQKRGLYRDFLDALEEAQAAADVRDHARIAKAADKDWKAAEAHLRLRNPGRYGSKRLEMTGADGKPIAVQASAEAGLLDLFRKLAGETTALPDAEANPGDGDANAGD